MKKIILTEITLFFFVACISVGLYQFIYGINLRCDNYLDMLTFEVRRTTIILEIIGIFFLPIHILLNIIRQFYFKFLRRYLAIEIIVECFLLTGLLFVKYLFLSSDSLEMADEGWTIYPPLTGISVLDEFDSLKLQQEKNITLIKIAVVLLVGIILTYISFGRRKSTGA